MSALTVRPRTLSAIVVAGLAFGLAACTQASTQLPVEAAGLPGVPAPAFGMAVGPLLDHGFALDIKAIVPGMLVSDIPYVAVPARPQLVEWLAVYGLDDDYLTGALKVGVSDGIDWSAHGTRAAGTASPGEILLDAHSGWNAHVVAHEAAHVLQFRNPSVLAQGLATAIPAYERDADCTAAVMLAATEHPPETDCSFDEINLAVQVIAGLPITVHPDVPTTAAQWSLIDTQLAAADHASTPSASAYTQPIAIGAPATPTTGDLIAARARAGLVTGVQRLIDQTAGPISGAEALADAKATSGEIPRLSWSTWFGLAVFELPGLRALAGVDTLAVGDSILVVDEPRASDAAIAKVLAARVDGVSQCWAPALAWAASGFVDGRDWGGRHTYRFEDLPMTCTRGQMLADAKVWSTSGLTSTVPVPALARADDATAPVTDADMWEVLAAAGLRDPMADSGW